MLGGECDRASSGGTSSGGTSSGGTSSGGSGGPGGRHGCGTAFLPQVSLICLPRQYSGAEVGAESNPGLTLQPQPLRCPRGRGWASYCCPGHRYPCGTPSPCRR
ncbi:MAG: hypothetical protein EA368_13820 [Leptolyngbya sp. DLM2.Bin27]|nr:MAG: hypothetical protein EA368_13820 [Leptolyngbya sp. DLM2.Bin27]